MAKITSVTVDVNCALSVTRDTAEACLKLVELYLNSNKGCMLRTIRDESGKVKLCLTSEEEWMKNDKDD